MYVDNIFKNLVNQRNSLQVLQKFQQTPLIKDTSSLFPPTTRAAP